MNKSTIRTRFAPSPTGTMHVGNLRTALYEFLTAKSANGVFVLRIEDTDRERFIEESVLPIYETLKDVGIVHDEGPDVGGPYAPYIQSERKDIYLPLALQLIKEDKAYYCFCKKEKYVSDNSDKQPVHGYDRRCRSLSESKIQENLSAGTAYAIRQKMPLSGETVFTDAVFGEIKVKNSELEDQILIKSDGYPTYNFANVVDDHMMDITHVIRGSEYLSSTPKYNLLYDAFGWKIPEYIHLPLIMGKNSDGSVSKLSKRHGSTAYKDLVNEGFLPEAIINYIALLGWCPKDNREIMEMDELVKSFSVNGISKSPAIFDYEKLKWMNSEYIKAMPLEDFHNMACEYYKIFGDSEYPKTKTISSLLQSRISCLTEIPEMISFFKDLKPYDPGIFIHKRMKTTLESSLEYLTDLQEMIKNLSPFTGESATELLKNYAKDNDLKNGQVMWPVRCALSGLMSSPGGAGELMDILGKEESIKRMEYAISLLKKHTAEDNLNE